MTYLLENWKGELEPVDPHFFDQALKLPRPTWMTFCDCGRAVPFGECCPRCEPAERPRVSLWRRLFRRKERP